MVRHALIQYPSIADLWVYVEHLLSCMERIRLLTESIVKTAPLPFFDRESRFYMPGDHDERICVLYEIKGAEGTLWPIPDDLFQISLEKGNSGRRGGGCLFAER